MSTPAALRTGAAIALFGIATPVTASTLAADVAPRGVWHYLGAEAETAHADPAAPGNEWGKGLRALLAPDTPAERRLDDALGIWQRLADQGDTASARAGCEFGGVFRIGLRPFTGSKGDRTWRSSQRKRYCERVDGGWAARHHSYALWQECHADAQFRARHSRKSAQRRCRYEQIERLGEIARSWAPAYESLGHNNWDANRIRKARAAWQAGADAGVPSAIVSLAFADTYRRRHDSGRHHALPLIIRIGNEVQAAHKRQTAKRWAKRAPQLLEAAMTGDERAMYHYAEAQLALIAAEHGKIPWTYTNAYLDPRYPVTPAEVAVGASLVRGIPDIRELKVPERLRAGREHRIEAMAWLAIVVGWTEPGELLAGAGLFRAAFSHQSAEIVLEALEEISPADDLAAAAARRDAILPTLGPGITVWDY